MNLTIEALNISRNFERDCENFLEAVRRIAQRYPDFNIACQNQTEIDIERLAARLKKVDDIVDPNITQNEKRERKGLLRDEAHISDIKSVTENTALVMIETELTHEDEAYRAADEIEAVVDGFETARNPVTGTVNKNENLFLFINVTFSCVRRKS